MTGYCGCRNERTVLVVANPLARARGRIGYLCVNGFDGVGRAGNVGRTGVDGSGRPTGE